MRIFCASQKIKTEKSVIKFTELTSVKINFIIHEIFTGYTGLKKNYKCGGGYKIKEEKTTKPICNFNSNFWLILDLS